MNIRLTIFIFSIAVIVVGMFAYSFLVKTESQSVQQGTQTSTTLPTAGSVPIPDENPNGWTSFQTLALNANDGGVVTVKNFLKDPETAVDPVNDGYYVLGYPIDKLSTDSIGSTSVPYLITYTASTQYFNVALLEEPLGQARELAQNYLLRYLGISEKDMCRLSYTLGAPNGVSQLYGGANLGFSF